MAEDGLDFRAWWNGQGNDVGAGTAGPTVIGGPEPLAGIGTGPHPNERVRRGNPFLEIEDRLRVLDERVAMLCRLLDELRATSDYDQEFFRSRVDSMDSQTRIALLVLLSLKDRL